MMRLLRRLRDASHRLTVITARLSLAALVLVTLADVLGRNLGQPLPGASELVSLLLAITFFSGMALASTHDSHIRVGFAVDRLFRGRMIRVESLLTRGTSAIALAVLAIVTFQEALEMHADHARTEFLNLPQSLLVGTLAVLAGLAAVSLALTAAGGSPDPEQSHSGNPP
jgi:TRAP-type transport system small permease protein